MTGSLSVVVVAHDMERELPRTLRTLASSRQTGDHAGGYELVVVDNGSSVPVDVDWLADLHDGPIVVVRVEGASPSPAPAANVGIGRASGSSIGLIIDGARMASPGLVAAAGAGLRVADRAVVASLGWHLGPTRHMEADDAGYDQEVEDRLLAGTDWESDGYELFGVSTLAGSSARGWFGPLGESSALFLPAELWSELGGLDERFDLPGGGLVNHDLFRRACDAEGTTLVMVLGEGTFHQFHGGAATSGRFTWDEMHAQYERLRGCAYRPPDRAPLFVGGVPAAALPFVEASVSLARRRGAGRAR